MDQLRKLILGNNKLKNVPLDDVFLRRFLGCSNYNVTLAYCKIKDYYSLLSEKPDWFASTSPLAMKEHIERNARTMLSGRDKEGRPLYFCNIGNLDYYNSSPAEVSQIDDIWFETVLDDAKAQEVGISVLIDMGTCPLQLLGWFTPSNLLTTSRKVDICPCNGIVYHVVNSCSLFNIITNLAWPFFSENIKKSTKVHYSNWSSLHKYISPEMLPSEYGGTGPEIDFEKLNQQLYQQDAKIRDRLKHRRMFQK